MADGSLEDDEAHWQRDSRLAAPPSAASGSGPRKAVDPFEVDQCGNGQENQMFVWQCGANAIGSG